MINKKNLNLKNDKRAVSPVIGVILMVAITVILAAVIAAFVFGINPTGQKTPNVQLQASVGITGGDLELQHMGGDPIDLSECIIKCKDKTWSSDAAWGNLTVGQSDSVAHSKAIGTGEAVDVEVIHAPSQSYVLNTVVTAA